MPRPPRIARRLWSLFEPIHAVTYFSAEPLAALSSAGYKGFWMGYFAGRSAPLGEVSAEIVFATFYNFSFEHVARAIPDAWHFAPPSAALAARLQGSAAVLDRAVPGGLVDQVRTAADLARVAAESAPMEGRPLFAANRQLPWPDDPIAVLWHACTLLREHRGDGHVAVLAAADVRGREANVLQTAAGAVPQEVFTMARRYSDEEWSVVSSGLVDRGLLAADGTLTPQGTDLRSELEERTDLAALSAYEALDDQQLDRLMSALAPIARAVVNTGDLPSVTPIGERFDTSSHGAG